VPSTQGKYVIVIRCPERRGIVAAVSGYLADHQQTIIESSQFCDASTNTFFMRVVFGPDCGVCPEIAVLRDSFAPLAEGFAMDWELHDCAAKPRVLIAVSKFGHCLNDLLHRWRSGLLPIEIPAVISNHEDMRSFVEWNELPFHYLPVAKDSKAQQEAQIMSLVDELKVDLVVLARYMQILSPQLCAHLDGRCINIHHSFLPSFKGARPYHQAYARGVKMIGATAHYVTTDLDEGPIIAQDARPVDHAFSPEQLVALGQEVECAVLGRAVTAQVQHRILRNGAKTVVFA